ncbi:SAVED domain-containing protein [Chryseobacterium echinoideorum]|uniref:SAVED domain-containing protein n=1 Tax=Chryseobacterium echinoideorum TaxID=1549648 RepID=UPI001186DB83|nr:SAVED domain-containing protein [Chryseobacterium echinoideorum]
MSVSYIPEKIKILLWGKSAGRCQYRGCNTSLYRDDLTQAEFNQCYIAHIVADSPNGPRGHITRSEELKQSLNNLMLLCDTHHRLVDRVEIENHPEEVLLTMKKEHEDRIDLIAGISHNLKSEIIIYKASIGNNPVMMTYDSLKEFIIPEKYPTRNAATDLSLSNSTSVDSRKTFWELQLENLDDQFRDQILPRLRKSELSHLSLFAMAPIPLLIKLGTYLNDIQQIDVRQKRRNPDTWKFDEDLHTDYNLLLSQEVKKQVALKIELSAAIADERIITILGEDVSIHSLSIGNQDNDFVKSRKQIIDFGEKMKEAFREIKKIHGQDMILNVFPAMPISLAVQLGRVWMPKADLSMRIVDQNYVSGGFSEAFKITHF